MLTPAIALVGAGPVGLGSVKTAVQIGAGHAQWVVDPEAERRQVAATELSALGCASVDELPESESDIAVAAFSSISSTTTPVIETLLGRGYGVVTTCEALADPYAVGRQRLEAAARDAQRVIIVTGANPGFVMDRFPLLLAAASSGVTRIIVRRNLDTRSRRGPLVNKTGKGLTPQAFARQASEGLVGHVGLEASLRLLAVGLGWPKGPVELSIEPVLDADGLVAGQHQSARMVASQGVIEYELVMASTVKESVDEVVIDGTPPVHAILTGGYHGDLGTFARVANAVKALPRLKPGIYLPTDLPLWA